MLSAQLIQRLMKRLCQVLVSLTRVATSSAQRLRILLFCFRRFLTKIRSSPRRSTKSSSSESPPESYTVMTNAGSSGWCSPSHATFPSPLLPSYNRQTTPVSAANNTQEQVSTTMNPRRITLHAEVNDSNGSRISVEFTPVHASNGLRYENHPYVYVVVALYQDSEWS